MMKMSDFFRSIGLGSIIENKRKMNKILRLASFSPDFLYERKKDKKGRIYFDRFKYLGSGFGVSVHGYRIMRKNKEGNEVEKHVVMDWGIFAKGRQDSTVYNLYMDYDHDQGMYCFVEDADSNNAFEFKLYNGLEMLDRFSGLKSEHEVDMFEDSFEKVNVAMLMIYGTVVLPVVKNEESRMIRIREEEMQRELIARARRGDVEAEQHLYQLAQEQELDLRERLANEDLLSVFEGYFLNLVEQSGVFSILADIVTIDEITNEATEEKLYRLGLSITGTDVTAYINAEDIVGMPMLGMRFMGVGLLQGNTIIDNLH